MGSSSSDLASPTKKGLIGDPNLNSTNQEAHPLQYVAGWQRVGITWIDQARNVQSVPQKSSKGGQTTGYKYYADMVALICRGPVDALTHIIIDNDVIWSGVIARGNEQFITVPFKKSSMILYWGTADQDFNPTLQAVGHPAYRGQCYAFFPGLSFGLGRTDAPNIELGIRRVVNIPWLPGAITNADDANPVAVLAELLTDPLQGAGADPGLIDQAQWLTVAQQLCLEDAAFSPLITDATNTRQLFIQICEYFYGYLRWTNDNKLQIGLLRDAPTDLTGLVTLTASHLTDVPDISTNEWTTTFNRTIITFVERTRVWQDDYRVWFDQGNLNIVGQALVQQLDRKWITRNDVAQQLAQRAGKYYALPMFTGSLKCRRSAVATVLVGDWIVLDYDPVNLGFALVLQCTGIKANDDSSEEIELDVSGQNITTDPSELYDRDDVINAIPGSQDVQPLALWRVLELPKALISGGTTDPVVTALAVRGGFETISANVMDSPDDATYDLLGQITNFAFGGVLAVEYPNTTPKVDLAVGMIVTLAGPDTTIPDQTDLSSDNSRLLAFVGDEIMAVRQVVVLSANQVQLFVKRGKYDTTLLSHAAGDPVFLMAKRDLVRLHPDSYAADDSIFFKLQAVSAGEQYDLSLVESLHFVIGGRALQPQPFTNLTVNGSYSDPATFAAGSDIALGWTLTTNELFGNQIADEDYFSESGISTIINIFDNPTDLNRKAHLKVDPGDSSYTMANADLVAAFGGVEPTTFYVQVYSKKAGQKSFSDIDCVVNRT